MPIRIKPSYKLPPCVLTLESIEKIAELVNRDFSNNLDMISFSASDGVWEIYDEPCATFMRTIASRTKLDSFIVEINSQSSVDQMRLIFNEKEAEVTLVADLQNENWFEHFVIDLKKFLLPPSFTQLIVHVYGQQDFSFDIRLVFLAIPINPSLMISTPYCKIVIRQKPPNPFIESIKANIVSNIIWAVMLFLLGAVFTLITQQILRK